MKTMQGALFSAWLKRSRTRAAPTPTNISTNSEPLRLKNGTFGLAGDGAREQRLAGARRADEQHALGNPAADARVLLRVLQELDDLAQLVFGFVDARDVDELHLHVVFGGVDLRAAARERHHAAFGAAHAAEEEAPERHEKEERNHPAEELANPAVGDLAGVLHAVLLEVLDELRILDADGDEAAALAAVGLQLALDAILGNGDFLHLAVAHARLELAVGNRLAALQREEQGIADGQQQQDARARTTSSCPAAGRGGRRRPRGLGDFLRGLFSHLIRFYARYARRVFSSRLNCSRHRPRRRG